MKGKGNSGIRGSQKKGGFAQSLKTQLTQAYKNKVGFRIDSSGEKWFSAFPSIAGSYPVHFGVVIIQVSLTQPSPLPFFL